MHRLWRGKRPGPSRLHSGGTASQSRRGRRICLVPAAEDVHPTVEHHEEHIGVQLREDERGTGKVAFVPPPEEAGEGDDGHRGLG